MRLTLLAAGMALSVAPATAAVVPGLPSSFTSDFTAGGDLGGATLSSTSELTFGPTGASLDSEVTRFASGAGVDTSLTTPFGEVPFPDDVEEIDTDVLDIDIPVVGEVEVGFEETLIVDYASPTNVAKIGINLLFGAGDGDGIPNNPPIGPASDELGQVIATLDGGGTSTMTFSGADANEDGELTILAGLADVNELVFSGQDGAPVGNNFAVVGTVVPLPGAAWLFLGGAAVIGGYLRGTRRPNAA